jgi:hypothetical protein
MSSKYQLKEKQHEKQTLTKKGLKVILASRV